MTKAQQARFLFWLTAVLIIQKALTRLIIQDADFIVRAALICFMIITPRQALYEGENLHYRNKVNQYEFMLNHIGYRFVLRSSKVAPRLERGKTQMVSRLQIENTGFAPLYLDTKTYIVLHNEHESHTIPVDLNLTGFTRFLNVDIYITAPAGIAAGEYDLYLGNDLGIAFANNNIFNTVLRANRIGRVNTVNEIVP